MLVNALLLGGLPFGLLQLPLGAAIVYFDKINFLSKILFHAVISFHQPYRHLSD